MAASTINTMKPKPAAEIYGFVMYILAKLLFAAYLGWAFIPVKILYSWGLTYYPQKYWALAMPSFLLVAFIFAYIIYFCNNLARNPPLNDSRSRFDTYSCYSADSSQEQAVPPLYDLSLSEINDLVYAKSH